MDSDTGDHSKYIPEQLQNPKPQIEDENQKQHSKFISVYLKRPSRIGTTETKKVLKEERFTEFVEKCDPRLISHAGRLIYADGMFNPPEMEEHTECTYCNAKRNGETPPIPETHRKLKDFKSSEDISTLTLNDFGIYEKCILYMHLKGNYDYDYKPQIEFYMNVSACERQFHGRGKVSTIANTAGVPQQPHQGQIPPPPPVKEPPQKPT